VLSCDRSRSVVMPSMLVSALESYLQSRGLSYSTFIFFLCGHRHDRSVTVSPSFELPNATWYTLSLSKYPTQYQSAKRNLKASMRKPLGISSSYLVQGYRSREYGNSKDRRFWGIKLFITYIQILPSRMGLPTDSGPVATSVDICRCA
jgi:hypothetical protein